MTLWGLWASHTHSFMVARLRTGLFRRVFEKNNNAAIVTRKKQKGGCDRGVKGMGAEKKLKNDSSTRSRRSDVMKRRVGADGGRGAQLRAGLPMYNFPTQCLFNPQAKGDQQRKARGIAWGGRYQTPHTVMGREKVD